MKKSYLFILCGISILTLSGCLGTYFKDDADQPEGAFESLHSVPDRPQATHDQEEYYKIRKSLEQDHATSKESFEDNDSASNLKSLSKENN